MNASLAQRVTVALLILVAAGGALAVHLVSSRRSDSVRADRQATAQERIVDAVGRRAYYLEDVADMVGVHDDADVAEFTRYAHVRVRDEDADANAVVAVQWVRRSPSGQLAAAGDVPPEPRSSSRSSSVPPIPPMMPLRTRHAARWRLPPSVPPPYTNRWRSPDP